MEDLKRTDDLNPWHHREEFPDAWQTALIPAAVLFGVACCAVPLSAKTGLGYAAGYFLWAILVVGLLFLNRRGKLGAGLAIAYSAILLSVRGWDVSLGVLTLAVAVGAFAGAYLMTVTGKPWSLLPICAAAMGIAYAIVRTPWAVAALFPLPAAFLLGYATLKEVRRTTAVLWTMGGVLLSFAAVAVWYFLNRFGTVSVSAIREAISIWRSQAEQMIIGQYQNARNSLLTVQPQADNTQSLAELDALFSQDSVRTYVAGLFSLLPTLLILLCGIPAFFAQKLLVGAYNSNHLASVVSMESEIFEVGVPTAVLYGLAFFLTCFGSVTTNLFFALCENLFYLLLLPLCVVGVRALPALYRRFSPGVRVFAGVAGVGMLLCNFLTALSLIAFLGSVTTVSGAWARHLRNRPDDFDRFDDSDDGE